MNHFAQWLTLQEMGYVPTAQIAQLQGRPLMLPDESGALVPVTDIDMRFEDYMPMIKQFTPFTARLPKNHKFLVKDSSGTVTIKNKIGKEESEYATLPDEWWEYASFINNNKIVKKGKLE